MPPFTSGAPLPAVPADPSADGDVPGLPERHPGSGGAGDRQRLRAVADLPLDFDAAVRTLTPRLRRYATRRLGDRHEAEELVQEALLRAYQHRGELRTEDDVAAWTTCVTGRLVIDRLRVRGRSTPVAEVPEGTRTARDTADVVVARDQARLALDALDAMPARPAAVLWAREVEGLGYDEIGSRFAMTEPAVRSLLTRARKALRKEYAARGGALPGTGLVLLAPWVSGTGWLERLRAGLARGAAPAALGLAAAGIVTGSLVLPADPAPGDPAPPAVSSSWTPAAASAGHAGAAAERAVAAVAPDAPAAAAPAASDAPGGRAPAPTLLSSTGLNATCARTGTGSDSAGAGGAACAAGSGGSTVAVDLPLPPRPALLDAVVPGSGTDPRPETALETNAVSCDRLPDLPRTSCAPTGEDS